MVMCVRGVLAALLLGASGACDSPTDEGGSMRVVSSPLVPDSVFRGELKRGGDTIAITVQARTPAPWRLVLQASGRSADTLVAELFDLTASRVLAQVSSPGDAANPVVGTSWYRPNAGGRYQIRVRGAGRDDRGAFTARLQAIGDGPEEVSRAIAAGDTITGEKLDVTGDVDEFTFSGRAGEEIIVFLQALRSYLWMQVLDSASQGELGQVGSGEAATHLEESGTSRIRLSRDGRYLLRVQGGYLSEIPEGGLPYRFQVRHIDRRPESAATDLVAGTLSAFEAIDHVGDIDEFHFEGAAAQAVSVFLQLESDIAAGVSLELVGPGGQILGQIEKAARAHSSPDSLTTGRLTLPAGGRHTIRVSGLVPEAPSRAVGRYRIEVYSVDVRPEKLSSVVHIGDTIRGERIDRPGDIDEFTFSAVEGQELDLVLEGHDGLPGFHLQVLRDGGTPLASVATGYGLTGIGSASTRLFRIPATGSYRIRVEGIVHGHGAYEFEFYIIDRRPESVDSRVQVGMRVGEAIDRIGDIDEFQLTVPAPRDVTLVFREPTEHGAFFATVRREGIPYALAILSSFNRSSARFTLPDAGEYTVTVSASHHDREYTGRYEFEFIPIEHAPENVPAEYVVGDTITTETLDPAGDLDEFYFSGTAGQRLQAIFEDLATPREFRLRLVIFDAQTDEWVHGIGSNAFATFGTFTLPRTGRYRIVVDTYNHPWSVGETGLYRFVLLPGQ